MVLMAAEMLHVPSVARHFPDSAVWQWLKFHSEHVAWTGCSLHDLIQPSFSFMVGVALPFSIASRMGRGQSKAAMWRRTSVRYGRASVQTGRGLRGTRSGSETRRC